MSINNSLRVALVWNKQVFFEKTFTVMSEQLVTVGDGEKNQFIVPATGLPESFTMFERKGNDYVLRFTDKLDGNISLNDEEFDVEELIESGKATKQDSVSTEDGQASTYEVTLASGDWGMIQLGSTSIFFQALAELPLVPRRGLASGFEAALMGFLFLSTLGHLGFLMAAYLSYDPDAELSQIMIEDRFVKFAVDDIKEPIKEEEEVDIPEEDTTGKKAGGEEGKFGAEDSDIEESKIPKVDGEMKDEIDVKNLGVNKALSSKLLGSGPLKNIFGDTEGFDSKMNVAMSGEGGELQIGRGAGGMGMRGVGKGGGGDGFGRIGGLGKVDTGGGKGMGGKIGGKKKQKVKPKMSTGAPQIGDFCDKNNIRRVVGAKSNAITFCFEKELQSNPSLSGKIIARWKIGLDGAVMGNADIASSSMNNKNVEGCISRVIARMRFEAPNGGICVIEYPFVFSGLE